MARFPKREADIRTLVQNIIAGLADNPIAVLLLNLAARFVVRERKI